MFTRLYGGLRTRLNSAPHGLPPRVPRPARCLDVPEVVGDYGLRRWVGEIRPMTAYVTMAPAMNYIPPPQVLPRLDRSTSSASTLVPQWAVLSRPG